VPSSRRAGAAPSKSKQPPHRKLERAASRGIVWRGWTGRSVASAGSGRRGGSSIGKGKNQMVCSRNVKCVLKPTVSRPQGEHPETGMIGRRSAKTLGESTVSLIMVKRFGRHGYNRTRSRFGSQKVGCGRRTKIRLGSRSTTMNITSGTSLPFKSERKSIGKQKMARLKAILE